jgi:hypothetical protein
MVMKIETFLAYVFIKLCWMMTQVIHNVFINTKHSELYSRAIITLATDGGGEMDEDLNTGINTMSLAQRTLTYSCFAMSQQSVSLYFVHEICANCVNCGKPQINFPLRRVSHCWWINW